MSDHLHSSSEHLCSRLPLRTTAWAMIVLVLSSGCSSLATSLLDRPSEKHRYAVDLNMSADQKSNEVSWMGTKDLSTAQADDINVRSRTVSQRDERSPIAGGISGGHSFAPRRAVLRQPIPLSDQTEASAATESIAADSAQVGSAAADDGPIRSAVQPSVVRRSNRISEAETNSPDRSASDSQEDSFWSSDGGVSAWRPDAKESSRRSHNTGAPTAREAASRPLDASGDRGSSLSNPLPSSRNTEAIESAETAKSSRKSDVPVRRTPVDSELSVTNEDLSTDAQELNGQSSPVDSSDRTPSDSAPNTEATASPVPEPGVLERLRGLYAPRPADTEKFRKQMRRLSDPFGLLKERDEDAGPTTPIEETTEDQTAEVTEPVATAPENVEKTLDVQQLLDAAIAQAEADLEAWPRTPSGRPDRPGDWRRRQTDVRLMSLIAGRSADSVRIIESLPEEEQEFWQALMLAMHSYRSDEGTPESDQRLVETLEHLRTAERRLQPLAQLKIRRAVFCERIDGFGQVTEFPASDFDPGQRVLIYVDVRNFQSELTAQGRFRSEFDAVIEYLREDGGEVVETIPLPQIQDECDVERTDYFQSFELTIPALAGRYIARVRLKDLLNQQRAEVSLPFTVRSHQSGL